LQKLYQLTPDVAAAIIDYRDEDNAVTPGGAEAEYYLSLQPPYLPRNALFQTMRELLWVRGLTRELLFEEDANQNGLLDPEEDDGRETAPVDNGDGVLDMGWSEALTVHSSVRNDNASGQERVNIQTADEATLATVQGLSSELAKAIVAYRGRNRLENLADLLDVTAVTPQNQTAPANSTAALPSGPPGTPGVPSTPPPNSSSQSPGAKLISEDLFLKIADDLTASDSRELAGVININTANARVLACLPGVDTQLAQAIVSHRQSAGFFSSVASLLKVPGMTHQIFKQMAPRITARSETFRVLSEGKVQSTGARERIEVVVRLGSGSVETLSYREDL
jgi:competence ComEA-like helix-hairpin-helix protein